MRAVREGMAIVGWCGNRLGVVDHVEGRSIRLVTYSGERHFIPRSWVEYADDQVHLNRTCHAAEQEWETAELTTAR